MARAVQRLPQILLRGGRPYSLWTSIQDTLGVDAASTSYTQPTDVVVIDPRAVLERRADAVKAVTLPALPPALLPLLSQGVNELGDMDDPMDEWIFGERDEIFRYTCVGMAGTQSGFTSLITRDALEKAQSGSVPLPPWEEFRGMLAEGAAKFPSRKHPFLFAGHIVESPEAAVYTLSRGGSIVGVLLSSEAGGGD
ncbi:MAG: hypothetical protein J3K34DRAFT_423838 [Monoraphidium minutum]|nr:MAG: hypothetical protein J3K34DRAFT_423838 [Monoraphidium minutum]